MKPSFVAFYSFKGGVGRSLALCNLAWTLSRRGRRVLVIDLDLEAPSIDRVPALTPRKNADPRPGVVELITAYAETGELPDLEAHTYELPTGDPSGRLWIMPAGLRDAAYQESLARLDWSNLHPDGGSERFVADLRAKATETFLPHYVLVDSRTGFSDIGGFTTHVLADQVVLVFNLTRACLEGTIQAYRSMISRPEAPHFILVASPVPPVADEAGIIGDRLAAAGRHMERGLIYRQPIIQIDYDARMALTDELAVEEPEKYGAAARYEKLRDLIQRANPHEVYPALEEADRHRDSGRTGDAIDLLRAFVAEHGDNADGWVALGDLYRRLSRWPEAREAFDRAISLAPRLSDGHRGRGEVEVAAGDARAGIERLQIAERLGDRSPDLYRALRAAYEALDDLDGIRASGRKLVAAIIRELSEPDQTDPQPVQSIPTLRAHFIDQLTRFPPYRGFSPMRFWSQVMGSLSLDRSEKLRIVHFATSDEELETRLRELHRIFDEERTRWTETFGADLVRLMDRVAEHEGETGRDALLGVANDARLTAVALTWLALNDGGGTKRSDLEAAVAADPTYAPALYNWGNALDRLAAEAKGDERRALLRDACDRYRRALDIKPDMHEALYNWGNALGRLAAEAEGDERRALLRDACDRYRRALDIKPDKHEALNNWGSVLGRLAAEAEGDERRALLQDACDCFRRAVDIKPDMHEALNNWGNALDRLAAEAEGDERRALLRDACDRYRRAVDIKPDMHEALYNWGNALLRLAAEAEGDERRALLRDACDCFRRAVDIKPDKHEALYNWGNALDRLAAEAEGDERRALLRDACDRYRRALDIKPDKHEALNNWGNALDDLAAEAEGDERRALLRDACDRYRRAVDIKPDMHEALNNWGNALLRLAAEAEGDERAALLEEARQRCEQANAVKAHAGDYNLACALSLLGRFNEAWALLPGVFERGDVPRPYALADADLAPLWAARPEWRAAVAGG